MAGEDDPPMTGTELRKCLTAMGWSQRQLADYLAISQTAVQRMAMGKMAVRPNLAEWLWIRAAHCKENPFPEGWFN